MFADIGLEVSRAQRTRRSWTTLTSFALQAVLIGLLLLIPLLKTVGLPSGRTLPTPVSLGAPPAAAPPAQRRSSARPQSNLADNVLIVPRGIPPRVEMITETVAPPQLSYSDGGVEGALGPGSRVGVWQSLNDTFSHVIPPSRPASVQVHPFRTSNMLEGSLIRRVQPVYPPMAKLAHIQGPVVLAAVISKAGTIDNLKALSGHPMLIPAAIDAVSQWRYRPYILNGEPIEVETQITVNFILSGN
jgi:periplasmic protein TonB